jgi:hypothetical protein
VAALVPVLLWLRSVLVHKHHPLRPFLLQNIAAVVAVVPAV